MSKHIFITFNDNYDGIFQSQVIDVLKMYQSEGIYFKLISFISIRKFFKQRDKILKNYPNAILLPMFPKLKNWKLNRYILKHFLKHADLIISRGIFATNLALFAKNRNSRVVYNGRGAIFSEQNEFGVYNGTGLEESIFQLEKNAVLNSDTRISVSKNLIAYWHKNFKYEENYHKIIPSASSFSLVPQLFKIKENHRVTIVFSGSTSKWQSFELMCTHFDHFLASNKNLQIKILCKNSSIFSKLKEKYADAVQIMWVSHDKVKDILISADYGYVYRDKTETNKVASPVKIAEYLSCGLKLLISNSLGDYSNLITSNNLGFNLDSNNFNFSDIQKVSIEEKERIIKFATENLSIFSDKIKNKYLSLINENCSNN